MIFKFLKLEWKQFVRSATFGKSIALKIIIGFFALYFILSFSFIGAGSFFILKKTIGLRVTKDVELAGLDISEHGTIAYPGKRLREFEEDK